MDLMVVVLWCVCLASEAFVMIVGLAVADVGGIAFAASIATTRGVSRGQGPALDLGMALC